MVVGGGRRLMDWLLAAATLEGRAAQLDAARTLQHLLATRAPHARGPARGRAGAARALTARPARSVHRGGAAGAAARRAAAAGAGGARRRGR